MAIRRIVERGDPILAKVCRPVTEFNARLHTLLDDMADTLEDSGGVGLAAPQVGIMRRLCIVEDSEGEIIELINPEIIATEGEQTRARIRCACARRIAMAQHSKSRTRS